MSKLMRALGLMSGTSLDGIDVAMVTTDGDCQVQRGPAMTFPYNQEMRLLLRAAIEDARTLARKDDRPGALTQAEGALTSEHGRAVLKFLSAQEISRESIDVIGFHGQTVLHRPRGEPATGLGNGFTLQLGLGDVLAQSLGVPVIFDMRSADVERGGQGAPLVPVYHRALVAKLPQRPVAIVNIGGVANITWISADGDMVAFDTGPGNALIDDVVAATIGVAYDEGGALAAKGRVQHDILLAYLSHPYFSQVPPKSLDRNAFTSSLVGALRLDDALATLTAFTAEAIARSREHMREEPQLWVICGGGRKNRTLMRMIAERVLNAVVPADAVGLNGDSVEAEAWAYLAVRSLRGLPLTYPGTTGVAAPTGGGRLASTCP